MPVRGVAAAVSLSVLVACGCVHATDSPPADDSAVASATPAPTAAGTDRSPDAGAPSSAPSPSAATGRPSSATSALALTIDPSLEATLPDRVGTMRFLRHSLSPGGVSPPGFSDRLGRALLQAAGSGNGGLSVAWSAPATMTGRSEYEVTFLAIRIPGAAARTLRDVVAVEPLLAPGFSGWIGLGDYGQSSMLAVGDRLVASAGDTLYMIVFPARDAQPEASPGPGPAPTPPFTNEELFTALPASDPEPETPQPTPKAMPSIAPGVSPRPDPAAEALLPDSVRGASVKKVSGRGPALFSGEWIYLGIPAYVMAGQLGLDLRDRSAAGGHPEGISTFWIVATPIPGFDRPTILAAWLRPLLQYGLEATTVEADGRVALVYNNQAVCVDDGILYWMTYLDVGDFPPASPAPRPALRDLVIDTLKALP